MELKREIFPRVRKTTIPRPVGKLETDILGLAGAVCASQATINQPKPLNEMREHIHDFKSYQNIRMTMAGWFPEGQDPPVMESPPSTEWVKK
ncbi:MAG: hypothetical protein JRF30_01425 [Deltaproteobacteria bacterium]|nr:hypothetical protein [Deltaproteobacteria bacterium]MBW2329611.1 hypothetical protein [Deltaproteobacteria bacterium]